MPENKFGKYLMYAIGEIVLVAIGILLALSVNNWNEDQKRQNQRISLLENLKMDARATKENITLLIDIRKDILVRRRKYLDYASKKDLKISVDSLSHYANWEGDKSVEKWPILTTYEAALSSGEIELIQNRDLLQLYNNLKIRNEQRLKMADYHFQSELLFGINDFRKKYGSMELFFMGDEKAMEDLTDDPAKLRMAYYDDDTYSTIATEFDIWTNQLRILERIGQLNDSILIVLRQQLE